MNKNLFKFDIVSHVLFCTIIIYWFVIILNHGLTLNTFLYLTPWWWLAKLVIAAAFHEFVKRVLLNHTFLNQGFNILFPLQFWAWTNFISFQKKMTKFPVVYVLRLFLLHKFRNVKNVVYNYSCSMFIYC